MGFLFRPEALDGQRQAWLGGIRLIRPMSLTLLTAFMVSSAALVLAYLFVGEYTRKAHLKGVLVPDPGLVRLLPPQAATVLETRVRAGQAVRQGDPLFVLSVDHATLGVDAQAAAQPVDVRAPQDGVLAAELAEPGQQVSPAVALASLVPANAQLQAQLYAPSSTIGFLRPGQPVQLRYQAFPYQQFGHYPGQVLQVFRTPLQSGGPNSVEPLYRVTVALGQQAVSASGPAQPLSAGMQLEADVMLDRRRLIEWLFEPVPGLAGR